MSTGIRAAYRRQHPRANLVSAWRRAPALLPVARTRRLRSQSFEVCTILTDQPAAAHISTLAELRRQGVPTHVWCLADRGGLSGTEVAGRGPGTRFDLIRNLISRCRPDADLLVIDDDVRWTLGTPADFVALAQQADFVLAQPAHSFGSYVSHPITIGQPGTRARETTFVEIGPVLFIRAAQRELLLADDVAEGMGYGTELAWRALLEEQNLRMGIVDSVRISHLRPIGGDYDLTEQRTLGARRLAEAGLGTWSEAQRTLSRWWWWQTAPPWTTSAGLPGG